MSVYDFTVKDRKGEKVSLKAYEGKVLLIINSATECGFTPQYDELREIQNKYAERGFSILDFPCNQFGGQAPGTNEEIAQFCTMRYGVTFPIFGKLEVNGPGEDPLYTYLKAQKGFAGFDPAHELTPILEDILGKADPDYAKKTDIKWNFTKFLVDKKGEVLARFEPTTSLSVVEEAIAKALQA